MKLRITQSTARTGATPETSYWLWCPGCKDVHRITNLWDFDGNLEAPTFNPSILTKGGGYYKRDGSFVRGHRCHSFIRNGVWEFLSDCDHELAGKHVPMVDL